MNLPENLSATAKKVYELICNGQSPKSLEDLTTAYAPMPIGEESYKAIATADSLIVKGIVTLEKGKEASEDFYTLIKTQGETGPSEEADANEEYAKKTDTNEEEKRMIAILETHDKRLPEKELFDLYLKEQSQNGVDNATSTDELKTALQELTDAGVITSEGDSYRVKE